MDVHCPGGNATVEGEGGVRVAEYLTGVHVDRGRVGYAQRDEGGGERFNDIVR